MGQEGQRLDEKAAPAPGALAYDEAGAGPDLVLVHGLTFSRRTWDPIVERLAESFRCIAVDLPGHGASSSSAADPIAVTERLRSTLSRAGVTRPLMVGHSAGALVAMGYAARCPVSGVIDVDQPLLVAPFAATLQQLAAQLRGPEFAAAFARFEQHIGVDRLPEPERSRVALTRRVDQATVLEHWRAPMTTPPDALQAGVDAMLDAVAAPCLYLGGDELPERARMHMLAHLPSADIVIWPGRGHLAHLAEPDRFAALVRGFSTSMSETSPHRSGT